MRYLHEVSRVRFNVIRKIGVVYTVVVYSIRCAPIKHSYVITPII
nr:MAG TPA: hypothetical protein [Caudoviricetes sp.]